jgi:uncharacterized protein YndB with AHSA1/START domain
MLDQSSETVTIGAQPAEVWSVLSDFASYPRWAESVTVCEPISSHPDGSADQVHFVIDAGIIRDDYVLAYTWDAARLRVGWTLVSSQVQRAQVGSYALVARSGATDVTLTLAIELDLPLLAMFKRRAEKITMDTALRSLKARVEAGR